jgi:hypothetical protein
VLFVWCAVEMASDGMIHIQSFMKIGLGIQVSVITSTVREVSVFVFVMGVICVVHG